jgi:C4-dicarboxylate transporter DctQ subunit
MTKVLDRLYEFLEAVICVIMVLMTLTIFYAVFARGVGLPGPVWIVQFNEYAMLFATFLGSAWLLSKGKHVSIELIVCRFSERSRKILRIIHSFVGIVLCAILCWYGAVTTIEHFQRNVIHVQAVDVPMAYVLFVIPLGFFLLLIQFIRDFFAGLHAIRTPATPGLPGPECLEKSSEGGGY